MHFAVIWNVLCFRTFYSSTCAFHYAYHLQQFVQAPIHENSQPTMKFNFSSLVTKYENHILFYLRTLYYNSKEEIAGFKLATKPKRTLYSHLATASFFAVMTFSDKEAPQRICIFIVLCCASRYLLLGQYNPNIFFSCMHNITAPRWPTWKWLSRIYLRICGVGEGIVVRITYGAFQRDRPTKRMVQSV